MDSCKDMKKEKPKKRKSRRSDAVTRSSVLKYIILSLIKGLHKHVLRWWDIQSKVFEITFVHKSNTNWNESYLDLFKELDKTSKQYGRYLEEKDYECGCKRRCRANLRKLCEAKIFTEINLDREKLNVDKSIIIKRYKINIEDFTKLNLIDFEKQLKRNILKCADTIQSKTVTKINDTVESCAQSHCLCLSNLVESAESRLLEAQNTVDSAGVSNLDQYSEKSETVGYNEFLFSTTNDINHFSEVEYTESRLLDARNTVDCASISNHDHFAEKSGTVGCNEFSLSNTNDVHEFSEVEYAESRLLGARNTVDCASISNHDHQYAEKSETVGCNEFAFSNTNDIHEFSEVETAGNGVMDLTNSQNTIDFTSTCNSELNAEERKALRSNQSRLKFPNNGDVYKLPKVEMTGIGVMELTNSQNTIDSTSTYNSELNAEEREALRFRQSLLNFPSNGDFYNLPKVEYAESRLLDAKNTVCVSISNHDQYAEKSDTVGSNEFTFSNTTDIHKFSQDSMHPWYEKFCGIPFKDAIERDDPFLPSTISTTDDSLAPGHNYLTESEEWIEKFDSILESYEDTQVFI